MQKKKNLNEDVNKSSFSVCESILGAAKQTIQRKRVRKKAECAMVDKEM